MQSSSLVPFFAGLLLITASVQAQNRSAKSSLPKTKVTASTPQFPEFSLSRAEVEAHTRFLASDELEGRRTGEQGNRVAARYIAEQFRQLGLKPAGSVDNKPDYFQPIIWSASKRPIRAVCLWEKIPFNSAKSWSLWRVAQPIYRAKLFMLAMV